MKTSSLALLAIAAATSAVAAQTERAILNECIRASTPNQKIEKCSLALMQSNNSGMKERAFLRRGNAFMSLNRYDDAIRDFSSLIELNPKVAGYFDNRQWALRAVQRYEDALKDANSAVRIAPNHAFTFRSRGLLLDEMGRSNEAIVDLSQGLALSPSDAGLFIERGKILAKLGREKDARLDFERALEIEPANEDARVGLASLPSPSTRSNPPPVSPPPVSAKRTSSGSGFRISNGFFVSNNHVITGCTNLWVDGRPGARVIASDQIRDLALISISGDQGESASIRSTRIELNETVTAAGFPLDGVFSGIAITNGTITRLSGLKGDTGEVQISAPVQPGNSGGPLLDAAANVIGVVSSKLDALRTVAAIGDVPQNINFAITGAALRSFLDAKGASYTESGRQPELSGVKIAANASKFTVLIECKG